MYLKIFSNLLIICLLCASAELLACAATSDNQTLASGTWGGRGALLKSGQTGAVIEFDCAFGQITAPFSVDINGKFSVPGTYAHETGGPGRPSDPEPKGSQAVFSGQVIGEQMVLRVELVEQGRSIGPFTLNKSKQAELEKCL